MVEIVLFAAAASFLLAAAHPFVFYPATLKLIAHFHKRPVSLMSDDELSRCRAALCLCVYNEQHVIRAKVENMLAMRSSIPDLEILVYIDAASDRTGEILSEYADKIHIIKSPSRFGKTHGMNVLVEAASADLIVFTDANVIFADDALIHLLRPFADPMVGCTLGHLRYVTAVQNATSATGSLYWNLEEQIKELESLTGSAITSDGSIFAIRRTLHQPPPPEVSDDIHVSLSILCAGYRVIRVGDAIAYEEAVSSATEEFSRKIRIACLAFTAHRMLWSQLRGLSVLNLYKYVSHKLLRWLTIYLLGFAAMFALGGLVHAVGWLLTLYIAIVAVLAARVVWLTPTGTLARLSSIFQAFVATGIGVWRSFQGVRFQTWSPPASTRMQMVTAQEALEPPRYIARQSPKQVNVDA